MKIEFLLNYFFRIILPCSILFTLAFCHDPLAKKNVNHDIEKKLFNAIELRKDSPREAINHLLVCDSLLKGKINERNLKFKVKKGLGISYHRFGNVDSAKYYLVESLQYFGTKKELGGIYMSLGNVFISENQFDSAKLYLERALKNFKELGLQTNIAKAKLNLANVLRLKGGFEQALSLYLESLDYFQANNNYPEIISALGNIGIIYMELGNYHDAKIYQHKVLKLIKRESLYYMLGGVYLTLSKLHQLESQYDSALIYSNLCLTDKFFNKSPLSVAHVYFDMATIYKGQGLIDSAKVYFEKSMNLCRKNGYSKLELRNRFGLASLELSGKEYDMASSALEQLSNEAYGFHSRFHQDVFSNLYNACKNKGDFKMALYFHELLLELKDSLSNEQIREQVLEKEKKYQLGVKDAEVKYLQQLVKKDRAIGYGTIGIMALSILLLVFVMLWATKKRSLLEKEKQFATKENQIIKTELELKNRELASNLLHLSSIQEILQQIKSKLKKQIKAGQFITENDLQVILQYIDNHENSERWREFYDRFDELEGDFLTKIASFYPKLTAAEIRLCGLLRLNLTNKDIAFLTNRSIRTVENLRFRIRKKMNLSQNANLVQHLLAI